jgi:hypothetical protein
VSVWTPSFFSVHFFTFPFTFFLPTVSYPLLDLIIGVGALHIQFNDDGGVGDSDGDLGLSALNRIALQLDITEDLFFNAECVGRRSGSDTVSLYV